MSTAILRLPLVKTKTGLAGSTIYKLIADGKFPPPVKLGPRSSGWLEAEVDEWIASRVRASRPAAVEDEASRAAEGRR